MAATRTSCGASQSLTRDGEETPAGLAPAASRGHRGQHLIVDEKRAEEVTHDEIDRLGRREGHRVGAMKDDAVREPVLRRQIARHVDHRHRLDRVNPRRAGAHGEHGKDPGPRTQVEDDVAGANQLADRPLVSVDAPRIDQHPPVVIEGSVVAAEGRHGRMLPSRLTLRSARFRDDSTPV